MELSRDIGRHDAQIESLQEDMKSVKSDLAEIKQILSEAKGGWKAMLVLGGVAGAAGAAISKLVAWYGSLA